LTVSGNTPRREENIMSQYHCPICFEEMEEGEPLWSVGVVYCSRHSKYNPVLIAFAKRWGKDTDKS
jgi:hypothetical protein